LLLLLQKSFQLSAVSGQLLGGWQKRRKIRQIHMPQRESRLHSGDS